MLLCRVSVSSAGNGGWPGQRGLCGEARAALCQTWAAPADPLQDMAEPHSQAAGASGKAYLRMAQKNPHQNAGPREEKGTECMMCVITHPCSKAYHSRTENLNFVAFRLFVVCTAVPFRKGALLYERYYQSK